MGDRLGTPGAVGFLLYYLCTPSTVHPLGVPCAFLNVLENHAQTVTIWTANTHWLRLQHQFLCLLPASPFGYN